ncbi:MAG: rhomboid family intramembrane serine protease [Marinifilaceae bacterium]
MEDLTKYNPKLERLRLKHSLIFPLAFLGLIWLIKIFEWGFELDLTTLGIFPLHLKGLPGILTAPLVHKDFEHLMANSTPFLVLSWGIFYFYRPLAYRIFILSYLMSNVLVWASAREAWHIGASGLVYAFASFLFFSGILRRYFRLMALSFTVVFLYGGMFWGIFPILKDVSWEGHLMGGFSGLALAIIYRKDGPQRPKSKWIEEDDDSIPEEIWNAENLKKENESSLPKEKKNHQQ